MSEYRIEKDIPIPLEYRGERYTRKLKYPWNVMNVGDSFAIPIPVNTTSKKIGQMILSARTSGFNYINRHCIAGVECVAYQVAETEWGKPRGGFKSQYIRVWWRKKDDS